MAQSLKTWVVGTSLVCVTVLGLGGFLLVKPQFDEASQVRDETAELATSNDELADEVAVLRADFAKIDEFRAALAQRRTKVPENADLSAMLRQIDAVAAAAGVTLITSSPGKAQAWEPPVEKEEEPAAEGDSEDAATPAPTATTAPTDDAEGAAEALTSDEVLKKVAAELADVEGLYAIPVTIDVVGPYDNVRSLISLLQTGDGRYFFAGNFTITHLEPGEASGGRPAINPGDVELALAASVFVLTATEGASAVAETPDQPAAPLPPAPAGKNPFGDAG